MKKILFVCGGTAGHINPAVSVADTIKKEHKEIQIVFVGNPSGMEARLVPQAGYRFIPFKAMGIQRKLTPNNIYRNIKSVGLLMSAAGRSKKILKEEAPDVVMGTGGYVSGPIVMQASKMGIKTLTHEQNALPGVTTKLLAKHVDTLLVAFEKAGERLGLPQKTIVTGNPVRQEILTADRTQARQKLHIKEDQFCILSFGGSLGAQRVNQAMAEVIDWHTKAKDTNIYHIHATGKNDKESFFDKIEELGTKYKNNSNLDIREYIDNMDICIAAADLVICRAGALTLSELQGAGKASILVPSPNVAENHQYHNAMELVNKNAARLIEEKNLTGKTMTDMVKNLYQSKRLVTEIGDNAKSMAIISANQVIAKEVLKLLNH